jgi:hypothetical protein
LNCGQYSSENVCPLGLTAIGGGRFKRALMSAVPSSQWPKDASFD